jgi:hypothetical protein
VFFHAIFFRLRLAERAEAKQFFGKGKAQNTFPGKLKPPPAGQKMFAAGHG